MRPAAFHDDSLGETTQVLVVTGELDMSSSSELRRRVEAALRDGRNCVVIDLDGVTHMDSSALAALIAAHQLVDERAGRLALAISVESVRRTLEIRGLDRLFTIAATRETAIERVCG